MIEQSIRAFAKKPLLRRTVGVPFLLALRTVGAIDSARRIARLCGFSPQIIKIRRHGFTFRMHGAGGRDQIPNRIWWLGWDDFERPMPDLFLALAREARIVVDVGANTGFYTLLALSCSQAIIHAYEPFPECRDWLVANLHLNPQAERVHAHAYALGDYSGAARLHVPKPLADHGLLETSCCLDSEFRPYDHVIDVPVVTLDEEFSGPEGDRVDLIKIDVEGTEHRVVSGAKRLLERSRPVVFLEILDETHATLLNLAFRGLDYDPLAIDSERMIPLTGFEKQAGVDNYMAIPHEKIDFLKQKIAQVRVAWINPMR